MRPPSEASGPSQLWRQARQPTKSLRTRCSAWDFLLCVAVTDPELMIFIKKCCDGWHSRKHCTVWHRHFSGEKSEEPRSAASSLRRQGPARTRRRSPLAVTLVTDTG